MLEKSFGLLFYLKKPKNFKKGNMPIYLRITVDGSPKELSTGRAWEPTRWNGHAQRASGTKEDSKVLNAFLDTLQSKVYEAKRQLLESNKVITAEMLKNILKGKTERPKMLLEIFRYHNDQLKELVGKEVSPATLERYKTAFDHTRSFLQWKYGVSDMEIKRLDLYTGGGDRKLFTQFICALLVIDFLSFLISLLICIELLPRLYNRAGTPRIPQYHQLFRSFEYVLRKFHQTLFKFLEQSSTKV